MRIEIDVPSSINEIPLKNYQAFLKVQKNSNDEEFIAEKMIEIFCGIELKEVAKMKLTSINELILHFNKIFAEKPKFQERFKIGGMEFGFIPDLENITFGEYVDLDNYLANWDDFHKAMAVMYRPITNSKKDKYEIFPYTGANEFCEAMKFAPMDVAIGASVFFWTLGNELLSATLNYLERETMKLTNKQRSILYDSNLGKNGVGMEAYTHSLTETLQNLTKSLNTDYINVLPISHSNRKKTK
ncbi:MAG: hypothetical protein EBT26_09990 [Microbacteriaceae bacterium]|nr:hypothetical protein [Microbacteriaceae bacterium]